MKKKKKMPRGKPAAAKPAPTRQAPSRPAKTAVRSSSKSQAPARRRGRPFVPPVIISAAGVLGFLAVALGAYGAHGLEKAFPEADLDMWNVAVDYQMLHAVGLLAIAFLRMRSPGNCWVGLTGLFWIVGIILFSGTIYPLALGSLKMLGPVTPVGGICLMVGWLLLIPAAIHEKKKKFDLPHRA